jgi:hypothetical protein
MAAMVAAGGLMASNMGFKLNYPLVAAGGGSLSGTNTIALPYNRQVGIDTASQLLADINLSGVSTIGLQRFDPLTDSNAPYPGVSDFALEAGTGYLVRTTTSGDYIIVGSHDPGLTIQWKAGAIGVSNSGSQRYAHPYHGVAATASELITETGALSVQRFDSATDSNEPYPGVADFALEPGVAYIVRVTGDTNFIPAHY